MKVPSKQELKQQLDAVTLERDNLQKALNALKTSKGPKAFLLACERIRLIMRAKAGLPPDDNIFSGLIRMSDQRERTRLSEHNVYGHSEMRLLSKVGGVEWKIMELIADMEDPYFISLDGEQRKEAILLKRAGMAGDSNVLNISMPVTDPAAIAKQSEQTAAVATKKKSIFPWRK